VATGEVGPTMRQGDMTLAMKRYALMHELQHVMVDYLHMALKYHPELVEVC